MHQVAKPYLANQRQGTAATKIRKYVSCGNQKQCRQKATGRARQRSTLPPRSAERDRDAVLRRVDVPPVVVGRRADRVRGARREARRGRRRRARDPHGREACDQGGVEEVGGPEGEREKGRGKVGEEARQ